MAIIETSVGQSPLSALVPPGDLREKEREEYDDEPTRALVPEHRDVTDKAWLLEQISNQNVARLFGLELLDHIGRLVTDEYRIDKLSRADWESKAEIAVAIVTQKIEPKQYPFPNASNVIWPLLTTATLQFNARAYPAIIRDNRVVKGVIEGSDRGTPATEDGRPTGPPRKAPDGSPIWLIRPGEKQLRATRISEHMSWQLLEQMPEWEPTLDQMLCQLPIVGGAIRKTYRDPAANRNFSVFVPLTDLVWSYYAQSFEAAPRHSEIIRLYPHEIVEFERADEMYLHYDYGTPGAMPEMPSAEQDGSDSEARHVFIEQHRRFDLDGDGYAEPWIITVHLGSAKVVRIVAGFDEEGLKADRHGRILRVDKLEQYTLFRFFPSLDGGSYPVGFGHLLRPLNEAINTTLNQMLDAGHLQNAGGGFISDQLSIKSGVVQWNVGRYTRVGTRGRDIREAVYTMQWPGPSAVLFQLLGLLISASKEVASTQDVLSGDASLANAQPTTLMALIEQGMRVYTAIHKRVFLALTDEFKKLYRLNRLYLDGPQPYMIGEESRETEKEDYRLGGGVKPAGDPSMVTDAQKLTRALVVQSVCKDNPLFNQTEYATRVLEAANVDRIQDLYAPPNPMQPLLAQLAMQKEQADLARTRAEEQNKAAQALLFMMQARKLSTDQGELDRIEANLEVMRLHLEAVNTSIKAADVAARSHNDARANEIQDAANRARRATEAGAPGINAGTGGAPAGDTGGSPIMEAAPGGAPSIPLPRGPEPGIPQAGDGAMGVR